MVKKKEGFFNAAHYESLIQSAFQNAINKTGNAGQIAILEELYEISGPALLKAGQLKRRPGRSVNRNIMAISISPEKYDAVDLIVEEIADQISQAWDDSYAGDNLGDKLYLQLGPDDFITTVPSSAASLFGFRAKLINGLL